MKNITTLSLVTVAILGLTGCGGGSGTSSNENTTIKSSSIKKLSTASNKHSKDDWIAIENAIQALDNTDKFNTVILESTEKNAALLNGVGIDKEMAYAMNSDAMFDDLTELDIEDLDNQVVTECKEDEICKEEAYASLNTNLEIDKEEAYAMAEDFRGDEKSLVNDKLVKEFKCEASEVRTVQHYGLEDLFSTANGTELTFQNPLDISQDMIDYNNNVNSGFANYDETANNRLFLEDIKNLPAGITKGRFYIGLKSNGSSLQGNDTFSIGDLSGTNDRYAKALTGLQGDGWQEDLVNSSNPTTAIYSNNFSNIPLNMQTANTTDTLLSIATSKQRFAAYVQDDTSVDFITIATCSKPDPIKEITAIVNKFECSENETMLKILGGEIDAFALATDANPINPSSDLKAPRDLATVYPGVDVPYDYTLYDHHFIDTLNLGLTTSQTVTKAEFNIGYKVIGSPLASNDAIYIGDFGTNYAGGHLYDTNYPIIPQGWNVNNINNYGHVANVNLFDLNNTLGAGNVANTMISKNELDVYVQDDTSVDFTQLNLCVKDNCDENAKDISVDLSQLASWTTSATDVNESNPIPKVWDNSLNWFNFTSQEANGQRVLEIPFCACSNTIINLKSLKADNVAVVTLDTPTNIIATQNASGQASMRADNNGGINASGSLTIPAGTNGGTDHTLRVEVSNQSLWFGVAMEGTLDFKGNLGKCK